MNASRLKQVEELFESALAVDQGMRDVFLRSHCGEDMDLLREVRSLLDCHDGSTTFLETPAINLDSVFPAAVTATTDADDPLLHQQIGSYRVLRRIGTGGMGVVYLAEQHHPRRVVALKLIRPGLASPGVLQRFEHEAQALGRLRHPGIAAIFEAGAARTALGVQPYVAMEYIAGPPLLQFAGARGLTVAQRVELMARIADAVQHAHTKGVIHRDLKPGNILIETPDAAAGVHGAADFQPKILDFGVSRITDPGPLDESIHTAPGAVLGTIPYMSPEQFDPSGAADTRTDTYALGVIAYELLTGALPIEVRSAALGAAARAICETPPARPSALHRSLRGDLDTILLKALEKDPARRYQTAAALADDLRRVLVNQPIQARPASTGYQFRKLVARHTISSALVAALFVLVLGFGAWMSVMYARAERLRQTAQEREGRARRMSQVLIDSLRAADPLIFRSRDIETRRAIANEILGIGTRRINDQLGDDPLLQAELQVAIAQIYDNLGLFAEALDLNERALESRRRLLGPMDPAVAEVLHFAAQSAYASSSPERAYQMMKEAVGIFENGGHTDHILYSASLSQFGTYALAAGHLDEAMTAFDRAGLLKQQVPGHEHGVYAITLNGVAGVLDSRGLHAEAEVVLRRAIELAGVDYPDDSPVIASLLNNLAWVIFAQHRAQEALEFGRRALDIRLKRLGPDNVKTADSLLVLGTITLDIGRAGDAEPLLRNALRLREAHVPDNIGLLGEARCALALCLGSLGRFDEAEPLMRDGIEALRRGLGPAHPTTLQGYDEAARFYDAWNKPVDAARFRDLIESARSNPGD
ncbi:MAG: tetratricopeptide repeat protein [Phycisphaerales bacterium]